MLFCVRCQLALAAAGAPDGTISINQSKLLRDIYTSEEQVSQKKCKKVPFQNIHVLKVSDELFMKQ